MLVLLDEFAVFGTLALLVALHAGLVEGAFAAGADLGYARHGVERCVDEVAVVADGDVAASGEGQGRVHGEFLVVRFSLGLLVSVLSEFERLNKPETLRPAL